MQSGTDDHGMRTTKRRRAAEGVRRGQHGSEQELHDLDSALDLLHSLARQERQREQLLRDKRGAQHQDLDSPTADGDVYGDEDATVSSFT